MDFSSLNMQEKADRGAVMQVIGPDGHTKLDGVTMTILGRDSTAYSRKMADIRRENVASRKPVDSEKIESEIIDGVVAAVTGWTGVDLDGTELKCTPENVRKLLSNPGYRWLTDQVLEFINDRANFFSLNGKS